MGPNYFLTSHFLVSLNTFFKDLFSSNNEYKYTTHINSDYMLMYVDNVMKYLEVKVNTEPLTESLSVISHHINLNFTTCISLHRALL